MSFNRTQRGLGIRSRRYAMIVENKVIKYLGIDDAGLNESSAENIIKQLGQNAL
jgi:peroxiredoxin